MFRRRHRDDPSDGFPTDHAGQKLQNRSVVDAMRNVSVDDTPQTRALLFQLLLESTIVVMSPNTPSGHRVWTAQAGESLQFVTTSDDEGTVLPVFTSVESLLQYRPTGAGYVALPASALFQMAEAGNTAKIAIDPGSPTRGIITRSEIEALARGRLPVGGSEIVAEATPIRIGRPAVPPPSPVLDAVVDALEATPAARRAWLTMLQHGETAPELVIVIRIDAVVGSGQDDIMRSIVDRAGKGSDGVRALRFMRADRDLEQTLDTGAGLEVFSR